MKDFLSEEIQNNHKSVYPNSHLFSNDVLMNTMEHYSSINNELYKSYFYKISKRPFSSHLSWVFPDNCKELSIDISVDPSTNNNIVLGTEVGFKISQPLGVELALEPLLPGEKGFFICKNWFRSFENNKYRDLKLTYKKDSKYDRNRKYNTFTLSPQRALLSGEKDDKARINYETFDFYKDTNPIGWKAMSVEIIDEYTLRLFLTDPIGIENFDFHDLVLCIKFSENIKDCEVGFHDIPGYFGNIIRGMTHEEIIQELKQNTVA